MGGSRFNFIEIISLHPSKEPFYISILWGNSTYRDFPESEKISCRDGFRLFINKKFSSKSTSKQPLVFYSANLEFVLPSVLSLRDGADRGCGKMSDVKFLIIGNKVYYIKIMVEGAWILFKNAGLILNLDLTEELRIEGRSYIPLGFYNEKCSESGDILSYLLNPHDSRKIEFILKNKGEPLLLKDGLFFSGISSKSISEKEICIGTRNNLLFLLREFKELDRKLRLFWKGWYFNYSIPSISKEIFDRFFNSFEINFEMPLELDTEIRKAYYGGRCEVFGNPGVGDIIYYFDFNNMYGQVMTEKFPKGRLRYIEKPQSIEKKGFYLISARSSKMPIPVLPIREEHDGFGEMTREYNVNAENRGLLFPNGDIYGLYYSEEVKLFEDEGGKVIDIIHAWVYDEGEKPIFKEFSENLIRLRDEDGSKLWKQLIVSLYGRMGMVPKNSTSILGTKDDYSEKTSGRDIRREVWFENYFIAEIKEEPGETVVSRVDYAAIITSRARIKLWRKIKEIEDSGMSVLYCDTDSIFFSTKKNIEDSTKSLDWREGKLLKIENAIFALQKTYSIRLNADSWETKIAGIPRNSISFEKFKKVFFEENYYGFNIPLTIKNVYSTERWIINSTVGVKTYTKRYFDISKRRTTPPYRIEKGGFGYSRIIKDPYF